MKKIRRITISNLSELDDISIHDIPFSLYQIQTISRFKNCKMDGFHKEYFPNGMLAGISHYKDGLLDGSYKKYHNRNGNIKLRINCFYKKERLHGPFESYYESGGIKCKCMYGDFGLDGPYECHYESGEISSRCIYKNAVLNGESITYYKDGTISSRLYYDDGALVKST